MKTAEQIGQEILDLATTHSTSLDSIMCAVRLTVAMADVGITEEGIARALMKMYPDEMKAIFAAVRIHDMYERKSQQSPFIPG